MPSSATKRQLAAEIAHWSLAIDALYDLDTAASPEGWRSLESYLSRKLRDRMHAMVAELRSEGADLMRWHDAGGEPHEVRRRLLRLRSRYLRAETILDFYSTAINSRSNPTMGSLLRGYDTLATDSMAAALLPLGHEPIPALVYAAIGKGASVLRADVQLWDHAHPSPAAAIKLTRHNLSHPTALFHETGHQVSHQIGWKAELAEALERELSPASRNVALMWASWSSEIAADVHAWAQSGWSSVAALANVVDGSTREVFHIRPGDPHPFPAARVAFNVAMCRSWFGAGPWDDLGQAWQERHDVESAGQAGEFMTISSGMMERIVEVCTRRPMKAFQGATVTHLIDPMRVSPSALAALATQAGPSLLTSTYLRRREPLRILGLLSARSLEEPHKAAEHRAVLRSWVTQVGADAIDATGARTSVTSPPSTLVA
ncbi:DUF2268 domain-containing protein [Salinibacterium sp. NYA9b]